MTNTGYLLSNGNDISTLFKETTGGATQTGLLMSNGSDIGTIFMAGTNSLTTKYYNQSGVDIGRLFLPKVLTFSMEKSYNITAYGLATANDGVAYISLQVASGPSVSKTTNYGYTWSSMTASAISGRAIAVNADNTLVIQANNTNINYSTNGGSSWTSVLSTTTPFSCFLPRIGNTIICSPYGQTKIYVSASPYSTITTTNTITGSTYNFSNMCSISDSNNYIYVKAGGTPAVYRNSTGGNLFSSATTMTTNVTLGGETNGLNSVACNADNSVNLITNGATGGSIFRSTSWDGTFTKVANTNIGGWIVISTSSAGNIVCACTPQTIYVSFDSGQTFAQSTTSQSIATGIRYASVSPDGKFITVLDVGTSTYVFTCIL